MKLATLRDGSRDGQLIVVGSDLKRFVVPHISAGKSLQSALDQWELVVSELEKIYHLLNREPSFGQPMLWDRVQAPLARAYEWVDGSAFLNHVRLVRRSRGAEMPDSFLTDPLVYQGGSGDMLAWNSPLHFNEDSWGLDFESEIAVILSDTPHKVKSADAGKYVRLVALVNDVSLRGLIPNELAKGFGFFCSKPATAFAPIVVTPDELGDDWKEGRLHLDVESKLNGKVFGNPNAGPEMHFSFFQLLEHITKTRSFTAGTILGSGTVSNEDRSRGSSCILERRMIEQIDQGSPKTPFLQPGDKVEIEVRDRHGSSVFGRICQSVLRV